MNSNDGMTTTIAELSSTAGITTDRAAEIMRATVEHLLTSRAVRAALKQRARQLRERATDLLARIDAEDDTSLADIAKGLGIPDEFVSTAYLDQLARRGLVSPAAGYASGGGG